MNATTTPQEIAEASISLNLGTVLKSEYYGKDVPMNCEYYAVIVKTNGDLRGAYCVGYINHFIEDGRFAYGNRTYFDENTEKKEILARFYALMAEELTNYGWGNLAIE